MKAFFRVGLGVVIGYALMVVLITLVQEAWFGGIAWGKTPSGILAAAGFFTCLAAAIGGIAATAISRTYGRSAAVIMSCVVMIETIVLVATDRVSGPLWFDVSASASLIVGILLGAELFLRLSGSAARHPA